MYQPQSELPLKKTSPLHQCSVFCTIIAPGLSGDLSWQTLASRVFKTFQRRHSRHSHGSRGLHRLTVPCLGDAPIRLGLAAGLPWMKNGPADVKRRCQRRLSKKNAIMFLPWLGPWEALTLFFHEKHSACWHALEKYVQNVRISLKSQSVY